MTKAKCPGSGQIPLRGQARSAFYPRCPECGREFSGQGRKWARKPNPWLAGCPSHFRTVASA